MLVLAPKAYLGWSWQFIPKLGNLQLGVQLKGRASDANTVAYYKGTHEALAEHRLSNADQVIQKLWDMYFSREPRSLVGFGALLEKFVEYQDLWELVFPSNRVTRFR